MKKVSKTLAIVLALIMVLTISVFAAWPTYQGDDNRDGRITGGAPIKPTTGTNPTVVHSFDLPYCNGNGWSGVDTEPVMQTVDGVTYAYVVYNANTVSGDTGGIRLAKVNCSASTPYVVWSKQLATTSGFAMCTPVLVQGSNANSEADDILYVGASGATQVLADPSLSTLPGQTVWTTSGTGTAASGSVTLGVGDEFTMTQSGFDLAGVSSNRVAMGIYVGTSPTTASAVTVTYTINGTTYTAQNFSSADLIQKGTTGEYYYYLNLNIGAISAQTTNTITYKVEMTAGASGSTVVVEYAELFQQSGGLMKVTGLESGLNGEAGVNPVSLTSDYTISGQFNTPLTYYTKGSGENKVEYLYFGVYTGTRSYYEYNIKTKKLYKFTPPSGSFYWAGANIVTVDGTDYVVFGSDAYTSNNTKYTYLYYRQVGSFGDDLSTSTVEPGTGGSYNLNGLGVTEAGNIRSSISKDSTYIYFTSQGPSSNSYIWRVPIASIGGTLTSSNVDHLELAADSSCTSTPAISTNGRIYVGYYNGFSSGGVKVISQSSFSILKTKTGIGPVQSSVIVHTSGTDDYLYITTNSNTDYAYCYKVDTADNNTFGLRWKASNGAYTLQGMAGCDGIVTYGNDGNDFYVVK